MKKHRESIAPCIQVTAYDVLQMRLNALRGYSPPVLPSGACLQVIRAPHAPARVIAPPSLVRARAGGWIWSSQ